MKFFQKKKGDSEWVGISDMMSGVMMVFMFIAILFMLYNEKEKDKIKLERDEARNLKVDAEKLAENFRLQKIESEKLAKKLQKTQESIREIAVTYRESQLSLNQDLHYEFDKDLERWGAEITKDNRIRFKSPDILFKSGSAEISKRFSLILKELFPRYIKILTSRKYRNEINEIRVEGHTSYGWGRARNEDYIYLKNMELSQKRASSVLKFCYSLSETAKYKKWIIDKFRANGMSYSKPIKKWSGKMDYTKSRRVEIIVTTKATEKIYKIIEELN